MRIRDIKKLKSDIAQVEKYIVDGRQEIKEQNNIMDRAALNIDHLESELSDEKRDFKVAKKMIVDCKKQLNDDTTTLNELNLNLAVMEGTIEYVRPRCKQRPPFETTLEGI